MLTGQAKEDFLEHYWNICLKKTRLSIKKHETEDFFNSLITILKQSLIVEWFDSVGIYIGIEPTMQIGLTFFRSKINDCVYDELEYKCSRPEATTAAIAKSNEIYNIHIANSEQK